MTSRGGSEGAFPSATSSHGTKRVQLSTRAVDDDDDGDDVVAGDEVSLLFKAQQEAYRRKGELANQTATRSLEAMRRYEAPSLDSARGKRKEEDETPIDPSDLIFDDDDRDGTSGVAAPAASTTASQPTDRPRIFYEEPLGVARPPWLPPMHGQYSLKSWEMQMAHLQQAKPRSIQEMYTAQSPQPWGVFVPPPPPPPPPSILQATTVEASGQPGSAPAPISSSDSTPTQSSISQPDKASDPSTESQETGATVTEHE